MGSTGGDAELSPAVPGSADYPAIFRYGGRTLAFILMGGLAFIGVSVLCARFPAITGLPVTASDQAVFWGLGLIVAAMGAFFIVGGLTSTLVLYKDAIEDRSIFLTRRLTRAQISGKRSFLGGKFTKGYMIYPISLGIRPIKIELVFKRTPAFDAWMEAVPELETLSSVKVPGRFLALLIGSSATGLTSGTTERWFATLNTASRIALRLVIFVAVWRLALIFMAWAVRRWRGSGPCA